MVPVLWLWGEPHQSSQDIVSHSALSPVDWQELDVSGGSSSKEAQARIA